MSIPLFRNRHVRYVFVVAALCLLVQVGDAVNRTYADHAGQALLFDGTNDFVSLGDTGNLLGGDGWASAKTISVWVKPDNSPPPTIPFHSGEIIVANDRPATFGIIRAISGGQDRLWVWNYDGSFDAVGIPYTANEWVQITLVHNGVSLFGYKNGALVGSTPSGPTFVPGGADGYLYLGGDGRTVTNRYTAGEIDEVRFWNTVVDTETIAVWTNQEVTPDHPQWANLVAYYRMSNGAGTAVTDDSDHNHTGTMGGGMGDANWVPSDAFGHDSTPTPSPTFTPAPPTETATETAVPPTDTPTFTPAPPTATVTETATFTPAPPTETATETAVPPTDTPTSTPAPPTETPISTPTPTATAVPTPLTEISYYVHPGQAVEVEVVGDYAYVTAVGAGLRIINIADPAHPFEAGYLDTPGQAYGVDVVGNLAYVADHHQGLRIINVSNPASPFQVGYIIPPGLSYDVTVSGSYAYLANRWDGVRIIDVSNPSQPVEVSSISTSEQTLEVFLDGSLLYLADYYAGVRVVDVSDPFHPLVLGSYDPGRAYGVTAVNNLIYVANGNDGLAILNATDPANITAVGSLRTAGLGRQVTVDGGIAYLSSWTESVIVLNISDPAHPVQTAVLNTPGWSESTTRHNDWLLIADYAGGLRIYQAITQ